MVVRLSLHQFRLRHILQSENAPLFTQVTPNTKHTINSKVTDSNAINRNQQQFFTSESTAHKLQQQPTDPWHQQSEQLNFRIFTFLHSRPTLGNIDSQHCAFYSNSNQQQQPTDLWLQQSEQFIRSGVSSSFPSTNSDVQIWAEQKVSPN